MGAHGIGVFGRIEQLRRLLKTEGLAGVISRARRRLSDRIRPPELQPLLNLQHDLEAAHVASLGASNWPPAIRAGSDGPLTVSWICSPPVPGSGGHTTIFRMVRALEAAGHRCVVYVRDRHGWPIERHVQTVTDWWPDVESEIRDFRHGVEDAHVIFATSWDTAYSAAGSAAAGKRCYFVQDFEPAFYPAGSEFLLAEATYRLGFHGVTAGPWLARKLNKDYGMRTDYFDFGCDLRHYRFDPAVLENDQSAICYYCRPSTPRRAHELAVLALEVFARRHPECEIRFFGEPCQRLTFDYTHLGLLSPAELGVLYNQCEAGLVLSATNVSLVPHEMLAAGCIPVVNDAEHNRVVLNSSYVEYAEPIPHRLAAKLCEIVERPLSARRDIARSASDSVTGITWHESGLKFIRSVERIAREA